MLDVLYILKYLKFIVIFVDVYIIFFDFILLILRIKLMFIEYFLFNMLR